VPCPAQNRTAPDAGCGVGGMERAADPKARPSAENGAVEARAAQMIIKPSRRGGFKAFSDYLAGEGGNANENEAVNLISDSLGIGSINGFCIFANRIAEPRRHGKHPLRNPIEHISIRTRKGDILTPKMMQSKIPELLKRLGYENCPWLLVQHIKGGEPHYHLGIVRIDEKGGVPNPKSKNICFELAQKFARELGFKPAFDGAKGSRYAQEQEHMARLWAATAKLSPADRLKKFRQAGFTPAKHDRRDEVVFIDTHGKPHSLHRIPALKAMGLKQSDITAAFGFNKAKLAALPTVKQALATLRRNAHVGRNISPTRALRTFSRVYGLHQNALQHVRTRRAAPNERSNGLFLLALLGLSRSQQRDELQSVRGGVAAGPLPRRRSKQTSDRKPMPSRLQATRGSWVGAKAEGVYKSMIAAGASPEQAEKAVEMVYIEEEQRLAYEQRYLDWVRGGKPQGAGQSISGGTRDSPMRNGKLL
jgi:hypothetical protein